MQLGLLFQKRRYITVAVLLDLSIVGYRRELVSKVGGDADRVV